MKNTECIDECFVLKLLSKKISTEYSISCADFPPEMGKAEIVLSAYQKAASLFDPENEESIATKTMRFYMDRLDEALEMFVENLDEFQAMSKLLIVFIKVQELINNGEQALEDKFSSELIENKDYYELFEIDYYFEKSRVSGIDATLSELEDDVNIRAFTYYNATYKEYLDIFPGFGEVMGNISG